MGGGRSSMDPGKTRERGLKQAERQLKRKARNRNTPMLPPMPLQPRQGSAMGGGKKRGMSAGGGLAL